MQLLEGNVHTQDPRTMRSIDATIRGKSYLVRMPDCTAVPGEMGYQFQVGFHRASGVRLYSEEELVRFHLLGDPKPAYIWHCREYFDLREVVHIERRDFGEVRCPGCGRWEFRFHPVRRYGEEFSLGYWERQWIRTQYPTVRKLVPRSIDSLLFCSNDCFQRAMQEIREERKCRNEVRQLLGNIKRFAQTGSVEQHPRVARRSRKGE